jgi:hypothetical protein
MKDNPADKVYTPEHVVLEVLEILKPYYDYWDTQQSTLEPFRGEGAFYHKLPLQTQWCEIDEGKDFFDYNDKVDWIITNPPYSIFDKCLDKMLSVADNICIVIPVNKILSSMPRLMDIKRSGKSITHIHYLGSGRQLKFPFGFPVGAVIIQSVDTDITKVTYSDKCYDSKKKKKRE